MFDINLFGCDFFLLQFNLCVHHLIAVCLFAMPFWAISYDAISSGRWSHRNFALRTSESKPTIVLHACCLHESTMSRSLNYLAVRENAVEKRVPNCVWCIGWWSRRRWNVWVSFSCHQRNVANAQSFAQFFFLSRRFVFAPYSVWYGSGAFNIFRLVCGHRSVLGRPYPEPHIVCVCAESDFYWKWHRHEAHVICY